MSRSPARPLALCTTLLLGGCGFHPLYGSSSASAVAAMPDIFVDKINDRAGQELRLALQQRLAGSSDKAPDGYTLTATFSVSGEAVSINSDNSAQRNRMVGRVHWTLSSVSPVPTALVSGDARLVDGNNIINEQYFASSIANDVTTQRLADNLADIVTTQLATWFVTHQNPVTAAPHPKAQSLQPQTVPGDSDQSPLSTVGEDGLPSSAIGRDGAEP